MDGGVDIRSASAMMGGIKKGLRWLLIESDSKTTIDLILGVEVVGFSRLALEVHNWMTRDWQGEIRHVPRTMNMAADAIHKARNANKVINCITKANRDIIEQLVILDDPSQYVKCWLEEDIRLLPVATDHFH
ncbi:hypothetical protein Gohar_019343 [Gossypium harknessii]|uniref:RNase H type-1 domain-containing protein n=1 Tax=Gossypium harknessii TaxID=34285 RepID=A0A7J9GCK8_9ROSI|nr:hypothetical protein [Gossypium harknessii]